MNIFFLDRDPNTAAKCHVDKHVVKMIIESAQLLNNNSYEKVMLPMNVNHPCSIWTGKCQENYSWLLQLFCNLLEEYRYRYDKVHKFHNYVGFFGEQERHLNRSKPFFDPPQCMPDKYKVENDTVEAYRRYYSLGKTHLHTWHNRPTPKWLIECRLNGF